MTNAPSSQIKHLSFNSKSLNQFETFSYAQELWPVVYLLSNNSNVKEAYVGETADLLARMEAHLKSDAKNKLTDAHLISSDQFNKSATLDIESNLIKYLSGDGQYQLLNGNIGLANHNYYQKQWYWELFKDVWNQLRKQGIVRHSIEYIDNSDLFKYSPYKSLTKEQKASIIHLLQSLLNEATQNIVLEGGAGTGKTVLAVFLFKLLNTPIADFNFTEFGEDEEQILNLTKALKAKYPNPKMALVVPMASFRKTLKKVFKNIKGLKPSMVVGPADIARERFDIIVVDEAHRLRRRVTLGSYFAAFDSASDNLGLDKYTHTELDWVQQQAGKTVLFYDKNQSIKPSDVRWEDFARVKNLPATIVYPLSSQLRSRGGKDYVHYIQQLLGCWLSDANTVFKSKKYELFLFDSLEEMVNQIKLKDTKMGLSRLVAGYSWPWISKNNPALKDIQIENLELQWNSTNEDWVNSANAINEVGCIHTTQGYDLNYAGIIFGKEISYDEEKDEIIVLKQHYHDKNGRTGVKDPAELKDFILNIYQTLMLRAIQGTYVYVCDEKLRRYFARHLQTFGEQQNIAPSSVAAESELRVPLYNLRAAAGAFSIEQHPEGVDTITIPNKYKTGKGLFACTVTGESMNKIIPNGAVCLFSRYTGGSRNGKIVLVELTDRQDPDTGSSYTVKEYHSTKIMSEEGWEHETITLKPLTNTEGYNEIQLSGSELYSLKVVGVFEQVL